LGSKREHKGCWITCTSHSFSSSSSLLLILWLMNVKEREEKKKVFKKNIKRDTPQVQGCCCCSTTTPQSKGFLCDDQKPYLGPSIILAIISCIYMKTHLYVHYSQSNYTFLKWFFFLLWWHPIIQDTKYWAIWLQYRNSMRVMISKLIGWWSIHYLLGKWSYLQIICSVGLIRAVQFSLIYLFIYLFSLFLTYSYNHTDIIAN